VRLAAGAQVAVARTSEGGELLTLLRNEAPTVAWILSAALLGLVRDHGAAHRDFESLRLCCTGVTRPLANSNASSRSSLDFAIHESYGMTETGCITVNPPRGVNKLGSIGRLAPGYELSLRDEAGRELETGKEGRLWIRSRCNTVGYWENLEGTGETIREGWLDTGDVMRVDPPLASSTEPRSSATPNGGSRPGPRTARQTDRRLRKPHTNRTDASYELVTYFRISTTCSGVVAHAIAPASTSLRAWTIFSSWSVI